MSNSNTPGPHVTQGQIWTVEQWNADLESRVEKVNADNGVARNLELNTPKITNGVATNLEIEGCIIRDATIYLRPGAGGIATLPGVPGPDGQPGAPGIAYPLPIGIIIPGRPQTGQVFNVSVPVPCALSSGLPGVTAYAGTVGTGNAMFLVNRVAQPSNVVSNLGNLTVMSGSHFTVLPAGTGGAFAAGDVLQLVCPTQDATLADLGITFLATRL